MDGKKSYGTFHSTEQSTIGENLDIEWREGLQGHVLDILICGESARHDRNSCPCTKSFDKL